MQTAVAHTAIDTRELIKGLRRPPESVETHDGSPAMPESFLWKTWIECEARGVEQATDYFLRSLKSLHRRRTIGAANLASVDPDPFEHELVTDVFLGELWKAYKKCIVQHRTGPAAQLLRDIEEQLR